MVDINVFIENIMKTEYKTDNAGWESSVSHVIYRYTDINNVLITLAESGSLVHILFCSTTLFCQSRS